MTRTAGWHTPDYDHRVDGPVEEREPHDEYDPSEYRRHDTDEFIPDRPGTKEEFDRRWGSDKDDHLRTEQRQGLIGMGVRADFPNNDNHWGYGYLDAIHGLPQEPSDPHGRQLSETDVAAYHDGYQFARQQHPKVAAVDHPLTTITHPDAHQGSLDDGSATDGKIVGQCPGCTKPIRKHKTAHGDELRHLHNNHVRCFGTGKTAGGFGEEAAEEVPGVGTALKAADVGGKALNGVEHELEKAPDMWAYRAESALQAYADYLGRPDAQNPTGRGPDEYKANTWDAYQRTRPMQSGEDRGINNPVLPAEPLKTRNINTPTPGLRGREDDLRHSDDEDEDDED